MLHLTDTVDTLTATNWEKIKTAYSYNHLKDGAVLIYIPMPCSYIYWHHPDKAAMSEIVSFLSDLNIKKLPS